MADTHQTRLLRALPDACKTLPVLSSELALTHRQVSNAASSLIRKGLVERSGSGCFRLTAQGEQTVAAGIEITSRPNAPHDGVRRPMADTLRQRAWTAMRIQRSFTIADLLVASSHGTRRDQQPATLSAHTREGRRGSAHEAARCRNAATSNGFLKYQLLRDLGEIAPTMRPKRGVLHDHNYGEEFVL